MTEAIKNIVSRNSSKTLIMPHPTPKEMEIVYNAALRAPDHAWLHPSRYIEIKGSGLDRLSRIFEDYIENNIENIDDAILDRYRNAPYRAPMVIVAITKTQDHPKVPKLEQMLSTAASIQNILLSLNALKYGSIWRTGPLALNEEIVKYFNLDKNHRILGYIYVGTAKGKPKKIPKLNIDDFVTTWHSDNS